MRVHHLPMTATKRRAARGAGPRATLDGREPYNTTLAPDVRELLETEAESKYNTRKRANFVIEHLAREHLKRAQ